MVGLKITGLVALAACLGALPAGAMPGKKQRATDKKAAKAANHNARAARLAAMNRTLFSVPPPPGKTPSGAVHLPGFAFQDGIHPFFKTFPIDKVGHFTFFCLEGEEGAQVVPGSLVTSGNGTIAWLTGRRDGVHRLSPTEGYRIIPWPGQEPAPEALAADDQDQLWVGGKGFRGRIQERKAHRDPGTGQVGFDLRIQKAPGPSGYLRILGDGAPWFHGPGGFMQFDDESRPSAAIPLAEPGAVHAAAWDATRRALYVIGPDLATLHRAVPGASTCPPGSWPLEPSGRRVHAIAADRTGLIWGTLPDQDALTVFNPDTLTWRTIEIVRSGSSRMLVTLPGIGFGAMVTQAGGPEAAPPSEPSAPGSASRRTPPRPAMMSGRQRRELAHQRMLEACERQRFAAASPGYYDELLGQSGTPDPGTAPDQPEDQQEGKTEAPGPAAPLYSAEAAQGYLLSRELFLTPVAIDHILERHGERHRDPSASAFRAPYRTHDGIQSLIAEGLGQVEDIEKNLRMDRRGRTYLLCTMPQAIGWSNGRATPKFLVGTARSYDDRARTFQYTVITAYPVHPDTR